MSGHQTRPAQSGPQTGQENRKDADKDTQENNLSTGHSDPDDGGADNAKPDSPGPNRH